VLSTLARQPCDRLPASQQRLANLHLHPERRRAAPARHSMGCRLDLRSRPRNGLYPGGRGDARSEKPSPAHRALRADGFIAPSFSSMGCAGSTSCHLTPAVIETDIRSLAVWEKALFFSRLCAGTAFVFISWPTDGTVLRLPPDAAPTARRVISRRTCLRRCWPVSKPVSASRSTA
jgi:hypothetical protein